MIVRVLEKLNTCNENLVLNVFLGHQIVDQYIGMNFILNEKWWSVDDRVRPILFILAPPNQLWIEVPVSTIIGKALADFLAIFLCLYLSATHLFARYMHGKKISGRKMGGVIIG